MKEPLRILRRAEAFNWLRRAGTAKSQKSAAAARLMAQLSEQFGTYNEKLGFHKGRHAVEDGEGVRWMLQESDRTGEEGPYTLAGRYLEKHPEFPGLSYDAKITRLVRLWKRTPKRRQTKNAK